MFAVLVADDEIQLRSILNAVLAQEGYTLSDSVTADGIVKIIRKGSASDASSLQQTALALGESLYAHKQGALYKSVLETIERPIIEHVLARTEGNQQKAARILGLNRNTLRTKIRKLGIQIRK